MPFNKGQSGNPSGRSKGAKNKFNVERQERLNQVLTMLESGIERYIAKLSAKDRVWLWKELLEYQLPKMQRMSFELDAECNGSIVKIYMPDNGRDKKI